MTSLPTLESVLHVDLGQGGESTRLLDEGWSAPQADGRRMRGRRSSVSFELPDRDGAFFLQVKVSPPSCPPAATPPEPDALRLILNGYEVASHVVRDRAGFTEYVPPEALAGEGPLRLVLAHADMTGDPADSVGIRAIRLLRVIERPSRRLRTRDAPEPPPLREMLLDFEHLGEGPTFALLRRRQGLRPLDVMQTGHATLADWVALLDSDFADFEAPGAIRAVAADPLEGEPSWSITCAGRAFNYDTGIAVAARDEAAVTGREQARLEIAVRWLRQTLASGSKMLLFHQDALSSDDQIIPLLAAVRDRGPNTILWVTSADDAHPPGSVEVLMTGLLRGYVPPGHGPEADVGWTQMCRLAWRSWRAMTGRGVTQRTPAGTASAAAAA